MESNDRHISESEMDRILLALEKEYNGRQEALKAYREVNSRLGLKQERSFSKWLIRIAAMLVIPLSAGLVWLLDETDSLRSVQWSEISVPSKESRDVILADGTRLTLNSGSRITYPDHFSGKSRDIFLDGEVFAEVAKDKKKPFLIHSGNTTLKVFGTKFDFKTYSKSDIVELLLIDGSVQLDMDFNGHKQIVNMIPGEFVQCSKSSRTIEKKQYLMNGNHAFNGSKDLSFRNVPLHDIALDMERRFGVNVIILNEEIAGRKAFAIFSNGENIETMLDALCESQGDIRYWENSGNYYIDRK